MSIRTHGKLFQVAVLLFAATFLAFFSTALADTSVDPLEALTAEIIPAEGTETFYGIPLSLSSLPQFVDWWTTLVPQVEGDSRYIEALSALVAPCCDDNLAFRCCCETEEGQACNIIRSGKGLAAHLILDLDSSTDDVRDSVLQWFRFARSDYYLAAGLLAQGIDPATYGLTIEGSCYRSLCNTPISQGGCGGMTTLIEPAIGIEG
jgi:hypothetical protein